MVVERNILFMDLDAFYALVLVLLNPELRGKPLLVGGGGDRGVVLSPSYEARRYGVRSGMPMKLARRLCPQGLVLKGDHEAFGNYSKMVTEIITERAPLVEKASIDEHYIDMTGMERYVGCEKWAKELKQTIVRETGLSISWGLSNSKSVAKVAANERKPDGALCVPPKDVQPFLWGLDVGKLPGIGPAMAHTLRCMGVTKLGTLAQIPRKILEKAFGKTGQFLWDRANGIDPSPVLPHDRQKSMSKEMTFQKDSTDIEMLRATLSRMVEGLAYDLRKGNWCAGKITVKVRYSDYQTYTKQITLPVTSSDYALTMATLKVFDALYTRRVLVRLVGVTFSKLVRGTEQLSLFDAAGQVAQPKLPSLYQKTDKIRHKLGERSIGRANSYHLGI